MQRDHEPEPALRGFPGFLLHGEGRCGLQHVRAKALAQHIGDYQGLVLDLGPQSGLIGALEPMSIEAVLAAPNWRIRSQSELRAQSHSVIGCSGCLLWFVTPGQ
jgi:hypothetical protein